MNIDPWTIFISAVIVAFAGAAVRGVFSIVKALTTMGKSIDRLIIADAKQSESIAMLAKLQRPQLAAHKATLEALKDGKCNGNVTSARKDIDDAFIEYDSFLVGRL